MLFVVYDPIASRMSRPKKKNASPRTLACMVRHARAYKRLPFMGNPLHVFLIYHLFLMRCM
ncbi:hypothetical protein BJY52DRAFT_1165919 [Lactarius psammicola]|nr:hypothetical protein BJY52DRAFT_1165919 [Lactarius psammicola]